MPAPMVPAPMTAMGADLGREVMEENFAFWVSKPLSRRRPSTQGLEEGHVRAAIPAQGRHATERSTSMRFLIAAFAALLATTGAATACRPAPPTVESVAMVLANSEHAFRGSVAEAD